MRRPRKAPCMSHVHLWLNLVVTLTWGDGNTWIPYRRCSVCGRLEMQ